MLRRLETFAWIAGFALLAIYAGTRATAERARLDGIAAIQQARAALSQDPPALRARARSPDTALWSSSRIDAWQRASAARDEPQAILDIDAVGLSVPVFEGTSDKNLNRGAGRIEGTAAIGAHGNVGLAAHRDGYFRALKEVRIGDELKLTTPRDELTYRIVATSVVEPTQVEVLAPTATPTLTLVTCYPFYFLGSAPQRFIVRAELREAPAAARTKEHDITSAPAAASS